jgi:hypothetical protein
MSDRELQVIFNFSCLLVALIILKADPTDPNTLYLDQVSETDPKGHIPMWVVKLRWKAALTVFESLRKRVEGSI